MATDMRVVAYFRMTADAPMRSAAEDELLAYCNRHHANVVARFFESRGVEQLQEAIACAKKLSAVLVIPRSVHIARNLPFLHTLWRGDVPFHICDSKRITNDTILNRIAEAVKRRKVIRETIKTVLAKKKAEGVLLGSARPGHWDGRRRGWQRAARISGENRMQRAREAYRVLEPQIFTMRNDGYSLSEIANWLNEGGHTTTAGKPFSPTAVWRIIQRAEALA